MKSKKIIDKVVDIQTQYFSFDSNMPKRQEYFKKELLIIGEKILKRKNLTPQELLFLYGIGNEVLGKELSEMKLQKDILQKRDILEDISTIFSIPIEKIATSKTELDSNPDNYYCFLGDLNLNKSITYPNLKYVVGNIYSRRERINNFPNLEIVTKDLIFYEAISVNFPKLKAVFGNVHLCNLRLFIGQTNLEYVGGSLELSNLLSAKALNNLKRVGSFVELNNIKDSAGLQNLKYVGSYLMLVSLKDATNLYNLEHVGYFLELDNLTSSKGLDNLKFVGGALMLDSLEDASSLTNLKRVDGALTLSNLENSKGLENLELVGEFLCVKALTTLRTFANTIIKGNVYIDTLKSGDGLDDIIIHGDIYFDMLPNIYILHKLKVRGNVCYLNSSVLDNKSDSYNLFNENDAKVLKREAIAKSKR